MNRRTFTKSVLAAAGAGCLPRRMEAATRPNVVVILLDDMGYSDIGCFGSEIRIPNVDRMAAEGVRFTQFYNTARCCPSRASILTGLYAHQAGVGDMDNDLGEPGYQGHLRRACVTLPEALRERGYRTIMAGKWHLGTGAPDLPWARGFDRFYGIRQGGGV
jgi:arylsulfatase